MLSARADELILPVFRRPQVCMNNRILKLLSRMVFGGFCYHDIAFKGFAIIFLTVVLKHMM